MKVAFHWLDAPVVADVAQRRADALCDALSEEQPVLFYGAPLMGTGLSLGAYQRAAIAISPQTALERTRRVSGGSAVYAGEGIFYFAVALANASALMECPPGRILNRNVRGVLQGLRGLGVAAHYFGRDFVSVATRPGVYVAWDQREDGRVLLEAFISHEQSYVLAPQHLAYPALQVDPFRGHAPITLREATMRTIEPAELFDQLLRGYAAMYKVDVKPLSAAAITATNDVGADLVNASEPQMLTWSPPYEESIGFVYAGVRLLSDGAIAHARVGGDYFQNRLGQRALEAALHGCAADGAALGRAINAVYADARHVLEGLRQMDSLRAVVLAAVEAAAQKL